MISSFYVGGCVTFLVIIFHLWLIMSMIMFQLFFMCSLKNLIYLMRLVLFMKCFHFKSRELNYGVSCALACFCELYKESMVMGIWFFLSPWQWEPYFLVATRVQPMGSWNLSSHGHGDLIAWFFFQWAVRPTTMESGELIPHGCGFSWIENFWKSCEAHGRAKGGIFFPRPWALFLCCLSLVLRGPKEQGRFPHPWRFY